MTKGNLIYTRKFRTVKISFIKYGKKYINYEMKTYHASLDHIHMTPDKGA